MKILSLVARPAFPFVALILSFGFLAVLPSARAELAFEKGDHVVYIGNALADRMQHDGWLETLIQSRHADKELVFRNMGFTGDQVKGSEWEGKVALEKLVVQYAGKEAAGTLEPVEPDAASPVLLLGDSHTLVFQEGASSGMHCKGAGLFDQLSYECGFPLDLVGVRGSGLVEARKSLYRAASPNPDYWTAKKAIVWVFSVREFTQSFDNLISIPIERKSS
ncbi:MAG: hypothetical protein KDM64_04330 [Verrucomicrobiae bacterium]|nr:hypothetical protein [Verrucomicrobiae bacterium]